MDRKPITSSDDARLLPRFRAAGSLIERHRMSRAQAAALADALGDDSNSKPLRHELTKPGDPRQLRGLPAIARGVSGASPGSQPELAIARLDRECDRRSAAA